MKRRALLSAIGVLVAASVIGMLATRTRDATPTAIGIDTGKRDSVWYHESDVALVAATARPQLVEFFHPD
jgi:hypothetical protein